MNNIESLVQGKKVYFASDFHLGAPNKVESFEREKIIVDWLESISSNCHTLFLLGDLFDFWFEYKHVVPKGYVRFLGKLANLKDNGVEIVIIVGNHDLWMKDYLEEEIGAKVYHDSFSIQINGNTFHLAHGDGLDPKDWKYRLIKKVFLFPLNQWLFKLIHPDFGIGLANGWSASSREELQSGHEDAYLIDHCREMEKQSHHDYYVFGDCHYHKEVKLNERSTYFNLGDWITKFSYLEFDGEKATLKQWLK